MQGPDNLVLLFYDGFERRAESALLPAAKALARRHARWWWRTLRRKQVKTGYYTAFLNLCLALRRAGMDVRINDFALARRYPDHPIGVTGYDTVMAKVDGLPNPRVWGPGAIPELLIAASAPGADPSPLHDPRNRLFMHRCPWVADVLGRYVNEDQMFYWFRGFDVGDFEDTRLLPKSYDVLIYDKIYHSREANLARTITPFVERLKAQGLRYKIFEYGAYNHDDYVAALRVSRCLAFFAHSETQGHAYQEAMAMNTPVFAWDEGVWLDPLAALVSSEPIACTSVPHFDDRCGVRFKAADMLTQWDRFWPIVDSFRPRNFVAESLSLEGSAEHYIRAYKAAATPPIDARIAASAIT